MPLGCAEAARRHGNRSGLDTTCLTHQQLLKLLGEAAPGASPVDHRGLSYYEAKHDASTG